MEYFVGKGVRVERQEVLTAQQMKEFGRPVATPDLLFLVRTECDDVANVVHVSIYGQHVRAAASRVQDNKTIVSRKDYYG